MSPLFSRAKKDGLDAAAAIRGEAFVIDGDSGISGTTQWSSLATLSISLPGRDPYQATLDCMVDRHKELVRGFAVPIDVDAADPNRLQVPWDEVPTIEERIACRDPAIIDPDATWQRIQDTRRRLNPIVPAQNPPWGAGSIEGWPPTEPLAKGRLAGTAWVIAHSADSRGCRSGEDSVMPPGRSHYRCKGVIEDGTHRFLAWLLLCVNPPYGDRYGVYLRTQVVRWRFSSVLPVAINPDEPSDIDIRWDSAANRAELLAAQVEASVAEMHERVETVTAVSASSTAAALANIADPTIRRQAGQMMAKYGAGTTPGDGPVVAAPPSALERLEKLRASGVLSDAEFDAERAKLQAGH